MNDLKKKLNEIIKKIFGVDFDAEVTGAPGNVEADFSSNAPLKLAGILKQKPMEIAGKIEKAFREPRASSPAVAGSSLGESLVSDSGLGSQKAFSIFTTTPGFLNFKMDDEYYLNILNNNTDWCEKKYDGKTVICEFSDPNPFKVLHVGHLYTSIVGDAISRLFECAGAKVVRANFGGDVGLHVAKTMWALTKKNLTEFDINDIAKCYVEGTQAYDEDEQAKAEIIEINKWIYEIAQNDLHDSELARKYWTGRELSYRYFEDFYAKIGVKFDKYYPESTVAGRGLKEVENGLAAGVYEMSDGAVIYPGEKVGLHTRVFINKAGLPTYEAKDVGLIFTKWDDWHFDRSVVITGNDIIEYMKVVLSSVGEMNAELPARTTHLTHGQVKLPGNVKMSSRKGNFLKAVDVLEMIKNELKEGYGSEDMKIILGATKYAFLKYKMGGDIIFDPKESVKMTGNSGPYLQYSCVRAKKILEKIHFVSPADAELNFFEKSLIRKIAEYREVLAGAVAEMAPHKICTYLYELAQEFSRFYENCAVVGDEREGLRGRIVEKYLETMTHGLKILGIEIPEEM